MRGGAADCSISSFRELLQNVLHHFIGWYREISRASNESCRHIEARGARYAYAAPLSFMEYEHCGASTSFCGTQRKFRDWRFQHSIRTPGFEVDEKYVYFAYKYWSLCFISSFLESSATTVLTRCSAVSAPSPSSHSLFLRSPHPTPTTSVVGSPRPPTSLPPTSRLRRRPSRLPLISLQRRPRARPSL